MRKLTGSFSRIGLCKVLVIGDFMLDTYTIGSVRRISPEAPVPVIQVKSEENRPGGAGNVVLNLISLGAEVVAVGRIGNDIPGEILRQELAKEGVDIQGLFRQTKFRTPVKNRIIAENQQIARVDHEEIAPLPEMMEQQFINALPQLLEGVQVIAISDYGKGSLSSSLLASLIELAKERSIPIIADPKGNQFAKYSGVNILKPNLSEAIAASGLSSEAPLHLVAEKILHISQAEIVMITRSAEGLSIFHRDGRNSHFPVHVREVKDVTGAGDTVLAILACAIANKIDIEEAAQLSNIAAGIAVEKMGCARITLSELARELLEYDVDNKVFEGHHLFALKEALKEEPFVILGLNSQEGMTPAIFKAIRTLSRKEQWSLIAYPRDEEVSFDFIDMLSSMHEVKFIISNRADVSKLCSEMHPKEFHIFEDGECKQLASIQAHLAP